MEYNEGIKAARTELESYLACVKSIDRCISDLHRLRDKMGVAPVQAPSVGLRKTIKLVSVLDPVTGRQSKQRRECLVPCHISVKTQSDPHREEARHAEVSYIEHTIDRKMIERGRLLLLITKRIEAIPEQHRKILHLRYIAGLSLEDITIQLDWFYSYRQVKRNMTRAVESYAKIHGFITFEKDVPDAPY